MIFKHLIALRHHYVVRFFNVFLNAIVPPYLFLFLQINKDLFLLFFQSPFHYLFLIYRFLAKNFLYLLFELPLLYAKTILLAPQRGCAVLINQLHSLEVQLVLQALHAAILVLERALIEEHIARVRPQRPAHSFIFSLTLVVHHLCVVLRTQVE